MKIKILGARGNIEKSSPSCHKHSGLLLDNKLLLDLGERQFLNFHPQWIFITHLHPDHAFFVQQLTKIPALLFAPEMSKCKQEIVVISSPTKVDHYQITPYPTLHSKKVKSQAYLIEKEKQKILYTGDIISFEKNPLLPRLDLVLTEASFGRKGGLVRKDKKTGEIYGHAGVPDLIKLFKPYTQKILLVHFGSWFVRDPKKGKERIEKLAEENKIELVVGSEKMIINL